MSNFVRDGSRLAVAGDLTESDEQELRSNCAKMILEDSELIEVDLCAVGQISSCCLGTLVSLWIDLCRMDRHLKVVPSETVQKSMDLSGLTELFEMAAGQRQAFGEI